MKNDNSKLLNGFTAFLILCGLGGLVLLFSLFFNFDQFDRDTQLYVASFGVGVAVQGISAYFVRRGRTWAKYALLIVQLLFLLFPIFLLSHFISPAWIVIFPFEIWLLFYQKRM